MERFIYSQSLSRYISSTLRFILVILSICISLLVSELLLRIPWHNSINTSAPPGLLDTSDTLIPSDLLKEQDVSEHTFNIYYFGESTMQGVPYHNAIPALIEKMIGTETIDNKKLRSINLAKSGENISQIKNRIKMLLTHRDIYHPSLIIVYSGHNEFLQYHDGIGFQLKGKIYPESINWIVSHSRIANILANILKYYKLEIDDRSFFDVPLFPIERYDDVVSGYMKQLTDLMDTLKQTGIPVIISTQVANYSDFEPNRSVFCANISDKEMFLENMNSGERYEQQSQYVQALEMYLNALSLCDTFAEAQYRLGKTYENLGRADDAWNAYKKAVDYDRMPMRAISAQNEFIRTLSDGNMIYTVDAEEYLRSFSGNGNIGYNLMIDGHHPNEMGYIYVSELIANKIHSVFKLKSPLKTISKSEFETYLIPTVEEKVRVYLLEAEWLIRIATWTYDPQSRLKIAESYISQALQIDPSSARANMELMTIKYLLKDNKSAIEYLNKTRKMDQYAVDEWMENYWVREIIARATL